MAKNTIFTGTATALITPLDENGINYELFGKLVEFQINQGVNALVVCGNSHTCTMWQMLLWNNRRVSNTLRRGTFRGNSSLC